MTVDLSSLTRKADNKLPVPSCPREIKRVMDAGQRVALRDTEKALGLRSTSAPRQRKHLGPLHKLAVVLVCNGWTYGDVAKYLRVGASTISNLMRDPLAKPLIEQVQEQHELELAGLTGLAIDATRDALKATDTNLRLKGVDRFVKMVGRFEQEGRAGDTTLIQQNIVNVREKFVESLRDIAGVEYENLGEDG